MEGLALHGVIGTLLSCTKRGGGRRTTDKDDGFGDKTLRKHLSVDFFSLGSREIICREWEPGKAVVTFKKSGEV